MARRNPAELDANRVDLVRDELEKAAAAERGHPPAAGALRPSFTLIPDWTMLCERINPTAFLLWCILRSMQFEGGSPIPPLTLDQVCWLLPGVKGKPTSRARAREALDMLLQEGLLSDVSEEGLSRSAARSYRAHDLPQGAMGWTSARRKLRRYFKGWRR